MEISFCDLRAKEVVNICDGKKLGNIVDLIFDSRTLRITGIVVPGERNFFSIFKSCPDIFIPFCKIRKIGKDVILVELNPVSASQVNTLDNKENLSTNTNNFKQQETYDDNLQTASESNETLQQD